MTLMLKSINGFTLKQPTSFDLEDYPLTKSGRVASGKMKIELVAWKRKFVFAYEVMSGPEIEQLKRAIRTNRMLFPLEYVENGVDYCAIVYGGAIKRQRFRTDGIWYWKNVTFNLIEE